MARLEAVDILVEGHVQGVGYRAWVERHAERLGLVGYVANLEDGRVRAWVEGERPVIEQLLPILEQGPRLARVTRMEVRWTAPTERYASFVVR